MSSGSHSPSPTAIHLGDIVAYSKRFLQSTGQYTGDAPLARGKVEGLRKLGEILLAQFEWDRGNLPTKVNAFNLSRVVDGVVMDAE